VRPVGIATDPATGGYWILTSNGGIANFDAPWYGSPKAAGQSGPGVAGIAATPNGSYLVFQEDGGVLDYQGPSASRSASQLIVNQRVMADLLSDPADLPVLRSALVYETGGQTSGMGGIDVVPSAIETSEVTFATDASSPRWDATHHVVVLDIEDWSLTPEREIDDPLAAMQAADEVATDHGLQLIPAPGLDLWRELDPRATSAVAGYLGANLAGDAASVSPVIEVQAQNLENTPAAFAALVDGAIAQADAQRPGVRVLVGISTNPTSGDPSPAELATDVAAAYDAGASGLWINVPADTAVCPTCGAPNPALAEWEVAQLATTGRGMP